MQCAEPFERYYYRVQYVMRWVFRTFSLDRVPVVR